ncbi:MAG: hypothetical protein M1815_002496 [Lichina confinis]|nr:MAG: hypothetical protein M1815_002496 [Lichina confinis]
MSAPNAGRQSPEPENQSGAQQQSAPGSGKVTDQPESLGDENKQQSDRTKMNELESNPKGPLEDAAKGKA